MFDAEMGALAQIPGIAAHQPVTAQVRPRYNRCLLKPGNCCECEVRKGQCWVVMDNMRSSKWHGQYGSDASEEHNNGHTALHGSRSCRL